MINSLPKPAFLAPKPTCGNCEYAETIPSDMQSIVCTGVPPTPCVVGVQQTVRGSQYAIELLKPQMPRLYKGCALHKMKAAPAAEVN
jgi:hypothetical protein